MSALGLSSSDAARYLGVSVSTLRRWADAGLLVYVRTPGNQRRFRQEDLDLFVASRRVDQQ